MLVFDEFSNSHDLKMWFEKMMIDVTHSYPLSDFSKIDPTFKMDTCIDIGCNVGAFSLNASNWFKEVVAFEPSYLTCLSAKIKLNQKEMKKNVKVYNMAVGRTTGDFLNLKCDVYDNKRNSGNASVVYNTQLQDYEKVPTISLDDIYNLCETDFIDYLKLDCEGSEYDILLGQDITRIGIMVMEIHAHPSQDFQKSRKQLLDYTSENFNIAVRGPHNALAVNKRFQIDPTTIFSGKVYEA